MTSISTGVQGNIQVIQLIFFIFVGMKPEFTHSTPFTSSMPACGNLTVLPLSRLSFGSSHAQIQLPQLLTPRTFRRALNGSDHYIYIYLFKTSRKMWSQQEAYLRNRQKHYIYWRNDVLIINKELTNVLHSPDKG